MKLFHKWTTEEVELTFGLKQLESMQLLDDWLKADEPADEYETITLRRHLARLVIMANNWNEDEIKFFFISNIISLVNFFKRGIYTAFSQRTVVVKVLDVQQQEQLLRGRVEFLVATGQQNPRQPFFFIHEYKPTYKTTPSDPLGQLLVTMFAAQNLNTEKRPLYGIYVVGKLWNFVVLEGLNYTVSRSYDATDGPTLFKIFSILKRCKNYIETAVAQP